MSVRERMQPTNISKLPLFWQVLACNLDGVADDISIGESKGRAVHK